MQGRRYTKTHTYNVSKTVDAPLRFVYGWCTDYQESDPKITGSKEKLKILLKTSSRVITTSTYTSDNGKLRSAVWVTTLYPPTTWHVNYVADEDDAIGDVFLTKLGQRRTRLDITITEHYKTRRLLGAKGTSEVWDKNVEALMKDYGSQK